MPNGPGMFRPAESAYARPGTYEAGLAAEATKQARYLSEMDQFYAQLEEMQAQFEKTHELALGRLEWEKEYGGEKLRLEEKGLGIEEKLGIGQLELGEERLEWEKEYGTEELGIKREQIEAQKGYWSGLLEESKATRIRGDESPFLSPYQDPRYQAPEEKKEWTPGETLEFMKGAWEVTGGEGTRRATFPGAGTAVYGPEGMMIAGGSEASYDPLARARYGD